jgi:ferritin-like metal-binding protein YciE
MAAKKEKTLTDLFEDGLKDIYYAEKKIVVALPKMQKAAESEELAAAFEKHHAETEQQVERLDQVFQILGQAPKGKKCPGIEGILEEGKEIMEEFKAPLPLMRVCWAPPRPSSITKSRATAR